MNKLYLRKSASYLAGIFASIFFGTIQFAQILCYNSFTFFYTIEFYWIKLKLYKILKFRLCVTMCWQKFSISFLPASYLLFFMRVRWADFIQFFLCVWVCVCECVCVCERERERKRERVFMCECLVSVWINRPDILSVTCKKTLHWFPPLKQVKFVLF